MLILWSQITSRFFTDPLRIIEDVPICGAGVVRDLTRCDDAKYIIFVLLSFSFRICWVIHSRISPIQCSKLFKEEDTFNSLSGSSDIYSCLYDVLTIFVIGFIRTSRQSFTSYVGMGSTAQKVLDDLFSNCLISVFVKGLNA